MVVSSVTVDVKPYLILAPKSLLFRASSQGPEASRASLRENTALGMTSKTRRCRSSENTTGTCVSKTHWPGAISGHDHDTPRRLIRLKNMIPMRTSVPLRNRMLSSGSRISTT